jgi:hypothetical protein
VCVFITAGPSTKLFAWGCVWGGADMGGHVLRETTSRGLCGLGGRVCRVCRRARVRVISARVCVFITAGPSTKLFTWGGGKWEDMCVCKSR